jgi:hypothetical protein
MRNTKGARASVRALRCESLEARQLLAIVGDPNLTIDPADLFRQVLIAPAAALDAAAETADTSRDQSQVGAAALPDPSSASVFDVRDYGAVGNGITDDSAAIIAALNAANASGGAAVYFSAGTYLVNQTLPLYQNVYHYGDGAGVSTIQQGEGATGSLFKAPATEIFNFGGFTDLTLRGESQQEFIGIDLSSVTGYLGIYHIDSIEVDGFGTGYYGAPFEYQNMTTRSTFKNNADAGAVVFENPYIYGSSFINNGVGLTGRLIDAFLVNNVFTGNDIGLAGSSGERISQSTISSNIFSGNSSIAMVIDDQNTVNNNQIDSGSLTTPAQYGIFVREDLNVFSGNQFGQPGISPNHDFSTAAIYFSALDRFGNPHAGGTFGYNTIVTENYFVAEAGPAIVAAPNMSLIGLSILDNTFELHGQPAIVFNANSSSWVRGNLISENQFLLTANSSQPVVQIARSFYGNSLQDNTFTVSPGVTTAGLVDLDARGTIFLGNTATGVTVGDQPWRLNASDTQTTVQSNQALNTNGQKIGLFTDQGTVTVAAAVSVIYVPFSAKFALVPSVADFRVSIVGDPGNSDSIWISSITADGFVLNLNQAPGTGSIQVAWSVAEQTYTGAPSANEPPGDPPRSETLPPLPIPDLSALPTFNIKDYGAQGFGGYDNTSAVLAAINAAANAGGGIVYIPKGQFMVTSTLPLRSGVYFQGDGANVSQLSQGAAATGPMFQVPSSGAFNGGGFLDLSLNGKVTKDTVGIDFSRVTGPLTNIYLDQVVVINFQLGYLGAANEQQTLMTNSLFGGGDVGIAINGDPTIVNSRFNGTQIGITGDLDGATIISNYFSSNAIGMMPIEGGRFQNSVIGANVFTGNALLGVIVDNDNTFYGNIINGSTAATPALAGLVVRGNNNIVSSNNFGLESGAPNVITLDFSVGNIVFSSTDWAGGPHPGGTFGSGTIIEHNNFTAQSGPALVGPTGTSLSGVSIVGNSFGLLAQSGILLNADPGYSVDGVTIADNIFVIKASLTATVLQIANTQTGNQITGNSFRADGGITSGAMIDMDAVGSTFVGNRATNVTVGQKPWNFRAIDAGTTVAANLAVDTTDNEVGMTETSGLKSITAGQTSVPITFSSPFALVPDVANFKFTFATWPGNATTAWATNISATGFTLNLDQAPGTTIFIGWSVFGTDFDAVAIPVAEVQGPATALRDFEQTFTLLASDGASTSFEFTIDWGDGSAPQLVTGPSGTQVTHTFSKVGPHVVSVVAATTYGISGLPATTNVAVTAVQLVSNGGALDLAWNGTAGADEVQFEQINANTIRVITLKENGVATNYSETYSGITGRVLANGAAGNDVLNASALTSTKTTLNGGADSNTLYGGAAGDILIGGSNGAEGRQGDNTIVAGRGANTIYGNDLAGRKGTIGGNNLIVGGSASDTIYGSFATVTSNGGEGGRNLIIAGGGADIVYSSQQADGAEGGNGSLIVSGTTSLSQAALVSVLSEWSSGRDYATRVENIRGLGTGTRSNGNNFLQPSNTVAGDAAIDQLYGDSNGDPNWFFYTLILDQINREKVGEILTSIN